MVANNNVEFSTLVDLLRYRAQNQPTQTAYTFLVDGETESVTLTYQELDQKARAIATQLRQRGVPNSRALLLYPPGIEFIPAFFGCLYAGFVAVPAYPPRRNQKMSRLQAIVSDAEAVVALTTSTELTSMTSQLAENKTLAAIPWITTDSLNTDIAEDWQHPHINSDTLAFLQYTSGSTGTPKGVMITHGNLLHNSQLIYNFYQHTSNSQGVIWLPPYHDMGLIGGVLQPLYGAFPVTLMAPAAFLQKPFRWLQAISNYKATTSGGPDFAYDLACRQITPEQLVSLDLSSWEVAFTGAEPIRAQTLDRFAETFAPCGFRKEAFYPCYGMAETTLIVSGGLTSQVPIVRHIDTTALLQNQVIDTTAAADGKAIVGCGKSSPDQTVLIVNPESFTRCADGQVGEVWVSGSSVAKGYWNRPEQTQNTFHAYLADNETGPFLRTGDLGFLQDGELFITGRLKDLIIIMGRNHYPQDIELTVQNCHPALRPAGGAAFAVEINNVEKLVIVQEVERSYLRKLNADEVIGAIRKAVAEHHDLQTHAIALIKTNSLPKTSSGKVRRSTCKAELEAETLDVVAQWSIDAQNNSPSEKSIAPQVEKIVNTEAIAAWLLTKVSEQLQVPPQTININEPLAQYGLGSLTAVRISGELQEWLGKELPTTLLYDYPSIAALAQYLGDGVPQPKIVSQQQTDNHAIAIVGIGCRYPGANNPETFWELLRNGVDAISEVPQQRWDVNAFYDPNRATPGKMNTRWGGFISQVDQFDAPFFGISPREAESLDPQQRLLLEVSWEALENAGKAPSKLARSNTGVFVGISNFDYSHLLAKQVSELDAYSGTGNAFSVAANRISYLLDLHGPCWAVDTACSSSLVAVHQACQSLRQGECEMALAAGVNLILTPQLTVTFSQAGMMASDGRCKTFDADADGYVRGEGCGVVVLKRLSDAYRDGDRILAVIKGSAVNQDGRSNGLTAPSGLAQQAVIRQAMQNAGVSPDEIGYVEAHGTGTFLGDPIEINSLKTVLTPGREPGDTCVIGSVKTNIGHLEAAAGIAGLIKTVLSLQHEEIPPHLHLKQVNPQISLVDANLSIATTLLPWNRGNKRRLAGVSSFGFGGTNAHVILEEAPLVSPKDSVSNERPLHLFTLSAKSENALRDLAQNYENYLGNNPDASLTDICFTANTGRSHFDHRLVAIAQSNTQLQTVLGAYAAGKKTSQLVSGRVDSKQYPKIAFLFTGQGSQYVNMGRQLYETQPTFRACIDQCDQILRSYLDQPLLSVLYPHTESSCIDETAYTQPAIFAVEYALVQLWKSWGVEPTAVIGHSFGEYVAACIAGVFSLEAGLKLVTERSRLMQEIKSMGAMAAVFATEEQVQAAIAEYSPEVTISAVNAPDNITISGTVAKIETAIAKFATQGIETRRLNVSHAFHSPLMDEMLDAFAQTTSKIEFQAPQIPFVSNITGNFLPAKQVPDAQYWRSHTRQSVKFMDGLNTLLAEGYELFIEIGAKPVLCSLGKRCQESENLLWLPSLNAKRENWQTLLESLSALYLRGVDIDWTGFENDYSPQLLPLPTYAFQRKRYWVRSSNTADNTQVNHQSHNSQPVCSANSDSKELPSQPLVEKMLKQQLQIMSQQLEVLRTHNLTTGQFLPLQNVQLPKPSKLNHKPSI
ncbi:type I polyketide synthase [Halotia branconii]|uniref:Beta-ketoacyl synthase N-terminal-like domain-containing protein n=1 Tax=Halotia branconii CENA392 TaxID=1539056 RepID=A0AAJ6NQB0_9CYAN|nr:type I polyketide synthase [Halotia branconii]WGV24576.1 beta-ketoacyl synthase N-terminal-like domain-containing protein [Halotia branconii CENA392]